MKWLTYKCPNCGNNLRVKLLRSVDTCIPCQTKIQLSPDPNRYKYFSLFNLVCALLIGWGIGSVRILSGEVFGLANLCADALAYFVFFCLARFVIFQFQTPGIVSESETEVGVKKSTSKGC